MREATRLITAPWILPITQPPIADGGVVVDDTDAILAIGRRADLLRLHPEATEERADGCLLPALVNAHCHLELSALAGAVPGGGGLIAWATKLIASFARSIRRAPRPPRPPRPPRWSPRAPPPSATWATA